MWCMINNDAVSDAAEWLRQYVDMPGVSHDGHNTVYPHIPPDSYNESALIIPESLIGGELIAFVGSFLANHVDRYMIGAPEKFIYLYNTPEWRLWCANYKPLNIHLFPLDKQSLGIDESLTQEQCHELIWHMFLNNN